MPIRAVGKIEHRCGSNDENGPNGLGIPGLLGHEQQENYQGYPEKAAQIKSDDHLHVWTSSRNIRETTLMVATPHGRAKVIYGKCTPKMPPSL